MNTQKGISVILILFLLSLAIGAIVIVGGLWYKKNVFDNYNLAKNTNQTATSNPTIPEKPIQPTTPTAETEDGFPTLPTEFIWEEKAIYLGDAAEAGYKIFYDNRIEIPQPRPQELYSGEILVTGIEYTTKTTVQTADEPYTSPYNTYMTALEEAGWVWRKDIYPFALTGVMADGPFGGQVSGYLKGDDKTVKTVILTKHIEGTVVNHISGYPPSMECPCTYTVKIFQSDPVSLEKHLP